MSCESTMFLCVFCVFCRVIEYPRVLLLPKLFVHKSLFMIIVLDELYRADRDVLTYLYS